MWPALSIYASPGAPLSPISYTTGSAQQTRVTGGLVTVYVNQQDGSNPAFALDCKHNRGFRGSYSQLFLSWKAQANTTLNFVMLRSCLTPWMTDDIDFAGAGVQSITVDAPLVNIGTANNPEIQIPAANTTTDGYLTHTDWNTFNGKQAALTIGNLTDAGTDGITVTGGTGAVIGSGTSISQHVADTTHAGYLASADWNTFNSKQAGPLTGDVTTSGAAATIAANAVTNAKAAQMGANTDWQGITRGVRLMRRT